MRVVPERCWSSGPWASGGGSQQAVVGAYKVFSAQGLAHRHTLVTWAVCHTGLFDELAECQPLQELTTK